MAEPPRTTRAGGASSWGTSEAPIAPLGLFVLVLVIATAGLVYELAMAAVASYLLGDSVTQFSLVIGTYLSALGLGAYLSRYIAERLALAFVDVELTTALCGGLSAPLLFTAHALTGAFQLVLYATVIVVGGLVGLELPLLLRVLERRLAFKELVAKALSFDYVGALVGSLAFSLFLVPKLGLVHTSLACGLINAGAGFTSTFLLRQLGSPVQWRAARWRALGVFTVLLVAWFQAHRVLEVSDAANYPGRTLVARQSAYQRIVLNDSDGDISLHLNGHLQFASKDEYRYHEALVHPALVLASERREVLIGGGGDGLAAREVLKWPEVARITLVDLDVEVTRLAQTEPELVALNRGALSAPRVSVVNADAMAWLREHTGSFDIEIFDFPDPSNFSVGKLYSHEFYRAAAQRLNANGILVVQATSPLVGRKAFWCIAETLQSVGLAVLPYHVFLPSFGSWGFVLASRRQLPVPRALPNLEFKFLTPPVLESLFHFPKDTSHLPVEPNRLNNQALVTYYLEGWAQWESQ